MVQVDNLGRILEEHPFAEGLDQALKDVMIGCAANERFEAGQFLFREGGDAKKFYLIRSGVVAVEVHAPGRPPLMVETVGDGGVLGWSWLVPPHKWAFDARAQTLVRALSFDATCLTRKMESDPALGYQVMKRFVPVMAHRLHAARMQMFDLYGPAKKG
ncbi:MAG: cyclic nucleotide-binding domain-containing protein [Alphaproteobacteria bacterium]|jgi:CRP/FNR family cyclic AMP-dependent transcriptional regulator|nr:cyclic nucleotide-binding domain-containing protein [Alphaproteobacteria bacterium]MBF0355383.1 cyclic nucleotide-binding domain-containing protein [Alphaproteobacteria bacterium]